MTINKLNDKCMNFLSFLKLLQCRYVNTYTSRNESVRIGFGSGFVTQVSTQQGIDSVSIRFDSISDFIDSDSSDKIYKSS